MVIEMANLGPIQGPGKTTNQPFTLEGTPILSRVFLTPCAPPKVNRSNESYINVGIAIIGHIVSPSPGQVC